MSRLAAAYEKTERLWWAINPRGIILLIAILSGVRFLVLNHAGMLWDEPYYWMWSRYPSFGYFDHPPMVAWWIWAGTHLAGDGVIGIRLPFFLNTLAVSAAAWGIGRILFTPRIGWLAALWTNLLPLFGIAGMMATPDGPSTLFWTLTVVAYAMVLRSGNGRWWLLVGLLAGLGLVSKYTNLFLGAGLVLSLLLDPSQRRWFRSPWLYAGGLVALIIFLPVIQWNAANAWISFRFQFGRIGEWNFDIARLLTLAVVQPLIFNPLAFLLLFSAPRLWQGIGPFQSYTGNLLATTLPAIAFITFQSLHGEVLQHWLAPVFPTLTVIAVAAASALAPEQWLMRRVRTDVVPFAITAAAVVFVYATLPLERWMPLGDPLNSMRGWPRFAAEVEDMRQTAGAAWIATVGYPATAQLTWELREKATVVPVAERHRYGFELTPDAALLDLPALVITRGSEADRVMMEHCFASLKPLGEVTRRSAAAGPLQAFEAFLGKGANPAAIGKTGCEAAVQ